MCFSAPVSFGASAVLATIGTILVARVGWSRLLPLALLPWFFSLQQLSEGIIWLQTPNVGVAKTIYLFFVIYFWPIWFPFAFWTAEKKGWKKLVLLSFIILGILWDILAFTFSPISSRTVLIDGCSISYFDHNPYPPFTKDFDQFFYIGLSAAIPFFSSIKKMGFLGIAFGASGIITYLIKAKTFISVWCFFAAIISLLLMFILDKKTIKAFRK